MLSFDRDFEGASRRAQTVLRYEIKLICDLQASSVAQARSWIRLHPAGFVIAYPPRRVNSLYFDTRAMSSLNDNLMGISTRQKLRLRWYGQDVAYNGHPAAIQPILELKQKRNMLGWKEQYPLSCVLDLTRPWAEIRDVMRRDLGPAWRIRMQTVECPTLLNHYRREYYATPDGAVRVTLDFDQAAYEQRFTPRPNLITRLPLTDNVVIEIKANREQGERLQEIAAQFPVRRHRNSKYVRGLVASVM